MDEHTPGPWKAGEIKGTPTGHIGRYRCITSDCNLIVHTWPDSCPAEAANARLIAAAPDLLVQCEAARAWLHNNGPLFTNPDLVESMDLLKSGLQDAIAKARGAVEDAPVDPTPEPQGDYP